MPRSSHRGQKTRRSLVEEFNDAERLVLALARGQAGGRVSRADDLVRIGKQTVLVFTALHCDLAFDHALLRAGYSHEQGRAGAGALAMDLPGQCQSETENKKLNVWGEFHGMMVVEV